MSESKDLDTYAIEIPFEALLYAVQQVMSVLDCDAQPELKSDGSNRFALSEPDLGNFGTVVVRKDEHNLAGLTFAVVKQAGRELTPQQLEDIQAIRDQQQRNTKYLELYKNINDEASLLNDKREARFIQVKETLLDMLENTLRSRNPRAADQLQTARKIRRADRAGATILPPWPAGRTVPQSTLEDETHAEDRQPTANELVKEQADSTLVKESRRKRIFGLRVDYLILGLTLGIAISVASLLLFPDWAHSNLTLLFLLLFPIAFTTATSFIANFRKAYE